MQPPDPLGAGRDTGPISLIAADLRPALLRYDSELIRDQIKILHDLAKMANLPDGWLVAAVYGQNPETGTDLPPRVYHFRIGDVDEMADVVASVEATPHANVYHPWAVMRPGLGRNQKGYEADVARVLALVLDDDADAGRPVRPPLEPEYILETSAGNRQLVYFLDRALPWQEAKQLAAALRHASGGDTGAVDMSHVWRIAGTANWPNKKKVMERGRPLSPQPVRVLKHWDGSL